MKKIQLTIAGMVLSASMALAQSVVTTTTPVEYAGTVSTFDPTAHTVVVSGAGGAPATYTYTPQTTVVDEAGNPVAWEVVRSGVPVKVYYSGQTASKIIVSQPAAVIQKEETTTTTTTHGN